MNKIDLSFTFKNTQTLIRRTKEDDYKKLNHPAIKVKPQGLKPGKICSI